MLIQLVCISNRRAVRKVVIILTIVYLLIPLMKLLATRLVLLFFTLEAATSLAASIRLRASSDVGIRDIKTRDVDSFDVYSRNIGAREPTPADFAAAGIDLETRDVDEFDIYSRSIEAREPTPADLAIADFDLERRNPVGAIIQVGKMIAEVVIKIKKAFEADKEVCCHLVLVHTSPNARDKLNSTGTSGRMSWSVDCMPRILLITTWSATRNTRTILMAYKAKIGITATRSFQSESFIRRLGEWICGRLNMFGADRMLRFEIYSFHGGTFKRIGDGGYLNVSKALKCIVPVINNLLMVVL